PDTLDRVEALTRHADFDLRNPNRFRALVQAFGAGNQRWFHDASGRGYALVARMIGEVDRVNRQIAARCIDVFASWQRFDPARQALMRGALDALLADPALSANAREMAERARAGS
ncbi:MAG: aminopeptidase N C-terminal domain-containing protein, partial [Rhodospirillales bacterium]|nr:aminopeptidase N C-terminal domain-containing protein [Rhodospirillales bacterium]